MNIKGNLDFNQNEARKLVIERLPAPPPNPVSGQVYYNTVDNFFYLFDSTNWVTLNNPPTTFTGNIVVTASGIDNYIGTGIPTITNYDINSIYLVTFANANTITTPTIDIDGVGILNIVKSDETGIVPLEIGDIQPAITYFLIWDGNVNMQLFTSSPSSQPGTGRGGNVILRTANAGLTGNAQNALTEVLKVTDTQSVFVKIPLTTPADKDFIDHGIVNTPQFTAYLDELNNFLYFKVKYSDGSFKEGKIKLL